LHVDPVEVDEKEITRSRPHEDKRRAVGGLTNRREEARKGLKDGAIR
jgi:hypothetical protein